MKALVASLLVAAGLAAAQTPEVPYPGSERILFQGGIRTGPVTAADLAADTNAAAGATVWCTDCDASAGCPGSGTGATATADGAGGWNCNGAGGAGLTCSGLCGCDICPFVNSCGDRICDTIEGNCDVLTRVQDEGIDITQNNTLNCVGPGIRCTDDGAGKTTVGVEADTPYCQDIWPLRGDYMTNVGIVAGKNVTGSRLLYAGCYCSGACSGTTVSFNFSSQTGRLFALEGNTPLECSSGGTFIQWRNFDAATTPIAASGEVLMANVNRVPLNDDKIHLCVFSQPLF